MNDLYPVAVFTARYDGTYESGKWIAVQAHADPGMGSVLKGCQGDDITCWNWFDNATFPIGRGDTPDEAVTDLARKLGSDWTPGDDDPKVRFSKALDALTGKEEK